MPGGSRHHPHGRSRHPAHLPHPGLRRHAGRETQVRRAWRGCQHAGAVRQRVASARWDGVSPVFSASTITSLTLRGEAAGNAAAPAIRAIVDARSPGHNALCVGHRGCRHAIVRRAPWPCPIHHPCANNKGATRRPCPFTTHQELNAWPRRPSRRGQVPWPGCASRCRSRCPAPPLRRARRPSAHRSTSAAPGCRCARAARRPA